MNTSSLAKSSRAKVLLSLKKKYISSLIRERSGRFATFLGAFRGTETLDRFARAAKLQVHSLW